MVAYAASVVHFVETSPTPPLNLIVPPAGTGYLVQALRVNSFIQTTAPDGSPKTLEIWYFNAPSNYVVLGPIPLPASADPVTIDIMPYLSNLAAFGLSNPSYLQMHLPHIPVGTEFVDIYGFSITGAEA